MQHPYLLPLEMLILKPFGAQLQVFYLLFSAIIACNFFWLPIDSISISFITLRQLIIRQMRFHQMRANP